MNALRNLRAAAVAAGLFAARLALQAEAVGEETGGLLTGTFNLANYLGAVAFVVAAACAVFRPRLVLPTALIAALLVLPMQSWRLVPGLWCYGGMCSMDYPNAQWNASSVLTLLNAAALLAFGLPLRQRAA